MTKQSIVLITVAVLLGAAYVAFFTDWFRKPRIQILAQIRPPRSSRSSSSPIDTAVYPVSFAFDKKYQFTEIKVVAVEDEKTNKFPHAVWHMISDSNSLPVKALVYGAPLRGMKPKVPKASPDSLIPEVAYRIYLDAGNAKGQQDFKTHELVAPGQ